MASERTTNAPGAMDTPWLGAVAFALAALLAACDTPDKPADNAPPPAQATGAQDPADASGAVSITGITLGHGMDASQKVTEPSSSFGPKDTIYAAVATRGKGSDIPLSAKWTFQDGQSVSETTTRISPTGPATTAFHIAKTDGLSLGKYKLEVSLGGASPTEQLFEVR